MTNNTTQKALRDALKALPQYQRVREEFELVAKAGQRACIDSAMLNVDALLDAALAHQAEHAEAEDDGMTREQWLAAAERVYLAVGDSEDEAKRLAAYQWSQRDPLTGEIDDPYEAALEDVEGRPGEHTEAGEAITNEQIRLELAKYEPRFRPEYAPFWQGVRFAERYHATPSPSQASEPPQQGEYHAWCGGIADEATLRRAVSVMEDVIGDIAGWEDTALADAVRASRNDIEAMVEAIKLRATPPASEAPPADTVVVSRELWEAWRGLCFGEDWNKGTHAKFHRKTIQRLMSESAISSVRSIQRASEAPATAGREGWKLVPVEPTDKMVNVNPSMLHPRIAAAIYRSMLAAAPADPEGGDHG